MKPKKNRGVPLMKNPPPPPPDRLVHLSGKSKAGTQEYDEQYLSSLRDKATPKKRYKPPNAVPLHQRDDTDYREAAREMIEVFLFDYENNRSAKEIAWARANQQTLKALALLRDNALYNAMLQFTGNGQYKSKEYFDRLIEEVEKFKL